ncbi:unnamed protein product [Thlaspi arvense]|uniref:Uncharacterized protein n=1 Tax=Thlaspi arvense TaxID=13288 RepID=A0AAU9RRC2_THLAR|nr:unnamed protein product [Thlaspi arvense]
MAETSLEHKFTLRLVVDEEKKKVILAEACSDFVDVLLSLDVPVAEAKVVDNIKDGVFVRGRSSFIITDDLKVAVRSTDLVLRKLKSVGCGDFSYDSAAICSLDGHVLEQAYPTRCQKQLLNITTAQRPPYQRTNSMVLIDPKSHGSDQPTESSGFVKRDTKFIVSDDLIITPMISTSTFCRLKQRISRCKKSASAKHR